MSGELAGLKTGVALVVGVLLVVSAIRIAAALRRLTPLAIAWYERVRGKVLEQIHKDRDFYDLNWCDKWSHRSYDRGSTT